MASLHHVCLPVCQGLAKDLDEQREALAAQQEEQRDLYATIKSERGRVRGWTGGVGGLLRSAAVARASACGGVLRRPCSRGVSWDRDAVSKPYSNVISTLLSTQGLEKDIAGLKREIRERDDTIGDKERRIYELKKKNQVCGESSLPRLGNEKGWCKPDHLRNTSPR